MIAKQLETILGAELKIAEAEMVQRFQKLRDIRLLPVSRGRNAEDITPNAIVSGLLSIVAERPAFAGQVANLLRHLRPVGGSINAFAKAETFGQALLAALDDESLLNSVTEIRVSDSEIYRNANGRAVIYYSDGDDEFVTFYVPSAAVSLLQPGKENDYDPRDLISSMIRETVILPRVLQKIMRQVRDDKQHALLMARPLGQSNEVR
ncbi:MAG: hypothetical protein ACLPID_07760 [Beijerinckiaceae bacterium]